MAKVKSMTEGKPLNLLISMAIPIALGYLFNQLYSIVDSVIVGQALGVNALAAVGSTAALNNLFCSLVIGTTVGAGILVGQYYGKGDEKQIAKSIANSVYFNCAISVLLMIIAIPFAKYWLILFNTPANILSDATIYMQLYTAGILFMTLFYMSFGILRSFGDAKTPLIFMIVSSLVNIVLDLLFIYVFHMGVAGAALATTLAQGIAMVGCLIYSIKTNIYFALAIKEHDLDFDMIKRGSSIGLSLGFQSALIYLSTSILQAVINGYGENTIAAFTVTSKLEMMVQQPVLALANTMTAYVSQNFGAGKMKRIDEGFRSCVILSIAYSLIMFVVFLLFGKYFVRLFVSNKEVISISAKGLIIEFIFIFGLCMNSILKNVLSGAGDASFPIYAGIVEIIARLAFCFILTNISFINIWGIWLTTGLTWSVVGLFSYIRYKAGKWKENSFA